MVPGRIPRPAAALVDGILLTLGTIYVVFFAESFLGPFQSFLITLGVPLAAWAGIFLSDLALRRRDYDEEALFDARGRYGSVDWISIGTMVLASVIGWGLVTNSYAEWLAWQGYLLEPLGLGTKSEVDGVQSWEGNWPWANLGVLVALVLGFVVTWLARRDIVAKQEAGQLTPEEQALAEAPPRRGDESVAPTRAASVAPLTMSAEESAEMARLDDLETS